MGGHWHDSTAATQNCGNMIGDRSCVRQSKLYRRYESGNQVKDLLGQSGLKWDENKKQGAYSGPVYDHNKANHSTSLTSNKSNAMGRPSAVNTGQDHQQTVRRRGADSYSEYMQGKGAAGSGGAAGGHMNDVMREQEEQRARELEREIVRANGEGHAYAGEGYAAYAGAAPPRGGYADPQGYAAYAGAVPPRGGSWYTDPQGYARAAGSGEGFADHQREYAGAPASTEGYADYQRGFARAADSSGGANWGYPDPQRGYADQQRGHAGMAAAKGQRIAVAVKDDHEFGATTAPSILATRPW